MTAPPPIRRSVFTKSVAYTKVGKLRRELMWNLRKLMELNRNSLSNTTRRDEHRRFIQRHIDNLNRTDYDVAAFSLSPSRRPEKVSVMCCIWESVTCAVVAYWRFRDTVKEHPEATMQIFEHERELRAVMQDWDNYRRYPNDLTVVGDVTGWALVYPKEEVSSGTTETMRLEGAEGQFVEGIPAVDGVRGVSSDRVDRTVFSISSGHGDVYPPGLEQSGIPNDAVDD